MSETTATVLGGVLVLYGLVALLFNRRWSDYMEAYWESVSFHDPEPWEGPARRVMGVVGAIACVVVGLYLIVR